MKPKVAVAMSGGVDSSVAAALLKDAGFEVFGIMLKLWAESSSSENRCCSNAAIDDARSVSVRLNIPFYVLDYRQIFKEIIVDSFLKDYNSGITPNPCFNCNLRIRFGYLLKEALRLGADYLATGHYAIVEKSPQDQFHLKIAKDKSKDQSYMLHRLSQFELGHALFPLGEYEKVKVRSLAQHYQLPTASKKESQDLCFLADDGHKGFMMRHLGPKIKPGKIKNLSKEVIGEHNGLALYTTGQRKGLNLRANQPYYVVAIDNENNELIVATDDQRGQTLFDTHSFHFINNAPPQLPFACQVKIRYKSPFYPASIIKIKNDRVQIKLGTTAKDITPGQGAVVYSGDFLIGGGIIAK